MSKQHCIHGDENCIRCAVSEVEAPIIHLHVILDGSPSMIGRWPQTLSGLNEYFDSLRADQAKEGQPYKVTMVTFSGKVRTRYNEVELDSIPRFTDENLNPEDYGTALWDAVGETVSKIVTTDPVLVVILTDGEENCSHNWDKITVSALMDAREKLGNYTYAYLGVTKEAWGNATGMGKGVQRNANNSVAADYGIGTYATLSASTVGYSSSMRSIRASGQSPNAMNVTNFWSPNTTASVAPDGSLTLHAGDDPSPTCTTSNTANPSK